MLNVAGPGGREQGLGMIPMHLQHPKWKNRLLVIASIVTGYTTYCLVWNVKVPGFWKHVENVWDENRSSEYDRHTCIEGRSSHDCFTVCRDVYPWRMIFPTLMQKYDHGYALETRSRAEGHEIKFIYAKICMSRFMVWYFFLSINEIHVIMWYIL